mgnify:CR=1 FL=1
MKSKISFSFIFFIVSINNDIIASTSRRSHTSTGVCIYLFGMEINAVATPSLVNWILHVSVPPVAEEFPQAGKKVQQGHCSCTFQRPQFKLLLPPGQNKEGAGNKVQYRDDFSSRRNVPPKKQYL